MSFMCFLWFRYFNIKKNQKSNILKHFQLMRLIIVDNFIYMIIYDDKMIN